MPAKPNLGDKPYSLDALGAQLDPKTYQEWKEALNARAEAFLKGESGMGSTFRRNATRTITDLLNRVEPNEEQKQQRRIDTALGKLKSQLGDIIASDDYCTRGIGSAGNMVDVPRGIAHQLKIDMQDNTLSTPDGGVIWRAVTVRPSAPAMPDHDGAKPVSDDSLDEAAARTWMIVEMARRQRAQEVKTGPAMVIAVRHRFPKLGERRARALHKFAKRTEIKARPTTQIAKHEPR